MGKKIKESQDVVKHLFRGFALTASCTNKIFIVFESPLPLACPAIPGRKA